MELARRRGLGPIERPAVTANRLTYSAAEAAQVLGVSEATIYRRAATGELPARRLGRRLIISKAALHRWLGDSADDSGPATKGEQEQHTGA